MYMVRVRVYNGEGEAMGDLQFSGDAVDRWLRKMNEEGVDKDSLCDLRDLVDPNDEQKNYDWDIWAKPAEVEEDMRRGL